MENIRNNVVEVLKQCNDPELPIDLWNLGLIYDLKINEEDEKFSVDIVMSLTTPGCTMGQYMIDDIKSKMSSIKSISRVDVELTFDPPWSPEMMTEEGKVKLGL
jgi:metal-sulfur cluster biosynthetic enzyme